MPRDIHFSLFVWSEEKERQNRERHNLSFLDAVKVFEDPFRFILLDHRHSESELRFYCVGAVSHDVVTVRFTLREDKLRIIGAGRWRKWRKIYEKKKSLR